MADQQKASVLYGWVTIYIVGVLTGTLLRMKGIPQAGRELLQV